MGETQGKSNSKRWLRIQAYGLLNKEEYIYTEVTGKGKDVLGFLGP